MFKMVKHDFKNSWKILLLIMIVFVILNIALYAFTNTKGSTFETLMIKGAGLSEEEIRNDEYISKRSAELVLPMMGIGLLSIGLVFLFFGYTSFKISKDLDSNYLTYLTPIKSSKLILSKVVWLFSISLILLITFNILQDLSFLDRFDFFSVGKSIGSSILFTFKYDLIKICYLLLFSVIMVFSIVMNQVKLFDKNIRIWWPIMAFLIVLGLNIIHSFMYSVNINKLLTINREGIKIMGTMRRFSFKNDIIFRCNRILHFNLENILFFLIASSVMIFIGSKLMENCIDVE